MKVRLCFTFALAVIHVIGGLHIRQHLPLRPVGLFDHLQRPWPPKALLGLLSGSWLAHQLMRMQLNLQLSLNDGGRTATLAILPRHATLMAVMASGVYSMINQ